MKATAIVALIALVVTSDAYYPPADPLEVKSEEPAPVYTSAPDALAKLDDTTTQGPPMPYSFEYQVKDEPSNNDFGHLEESDGKVVTGSYHVLLPDGRTQIVTYTADEKGYRAVVRYEGVAVAPVAARTENPLPVTKVEAVQVSSSSSVPAPKEDASALAAKTNYSPAPVERAGSALDYAEPSPSPKVDYSAPSERTDEPAPVNNYSESAPDAKTDSVEPAPVAKVDTSYAQSTPAAKTDLLEPAPVAKVEPSYSQPAPSAKSDYSAPAPSPKADYPAPSERIDEPAPVDVDYSAPAAKIDPLEPAPVAKVDKYYAQPAPIAKSDSAPSPKVDYSAPAPSERTDKLAPVSVDYSESAPVAKTDLQELAPVAKVETYYSQPAPGSKSDDSAPSSYSYYSSNAAPEVKADSQLAAPEKSEPTTPAIGDNYAPLAPEPRAEVQYPAPLSAKFARPAPKTDSVPAPAGRTTYPFPHPALRSNPRIATNIKYPPHTPSTKFNQEARSDISADSRALYPQIRVPKSEFPADAERDIKPFYPIPLQRSLYLAPESKSEETNTEAPAESPKVKEDTLAAPEAYSPSPAPKAQEYPVPDVKVSEAKESPAPAYPAPDAVPKAQVEYSAPDVKEVSQAKESSAPAYLAPDVAPKAEYSAPVIQESEVKESPAPVYPAPAADYSIPEAKNDHQTRAPEPQVASTAAPAEYKPPAPEAKVDLLGPVTQGYTLSQINEPTAPVASSKVDAESIPKANY